MSVSEQNDILSTMPLSHPELKRQDATCVSSDESHISSRLRRSVRERLSVPILPEVLARIATRCCIVKENNTTSYIRL
jgi:hypothetical protein